MSFIYINFLSSTPQVACICSGLGRIIFFGCSNMGFSHIGQLKIFCLTIFLLAQTVRSVHKTLKTVVVNLHYNLLVHSFLCYTFFFFRKYFQRRKFFIGIISGICCSSFFLCVFSCTGLKL